MTVITQLLLFVAAMFAKTAILALYWRIFSPSRRSRILILSGMAFTFIFYISVLIILAVRCTPTPGDYAHGGWISPQSIKRCNRYSAAATETSAVAGAVIDIFILLLPLFFVLQLQTSTKRKAGLAAIFMIGSSYAWNPLTSNLICLILSWLTICSACAFSIVSAYYRFQILLTIENDVTWAVMPIYGWGCVNLPAFLIRRDRR